MLMFYFITKFKLQVFLDTEDKPVLFIDEIHTIIGAGSASGGSLDVSNLLKPALGKGQIRCIGSTTFQEYRGIFDQNQGTLYQ